MTKLLKDSGVSVDKENLKIMIEKLQGRPIHEIIAEGFTKFASMPAGGGKFHLVINAMFSFIWCRRRWRCC